jgi:hypothetical protein
MVMFDADRLSSTVAPAMQANDDGGIGTHRSSQISTWNVSIGCPATRNRRSAPKGTSRWPSSSTRSKRA